MTALDRSPRRHPERIVRSYSSMSSAQRAAQTAACAGGSSATATTREPARKRLSGLPGNTYPNTGAGRASRSIAEAGLLCAPDRGMTLTLDEVRDLARAARRAPRPGDGGVRVSGVHVAAERVIVRGVVAVEARGERRKQALAVADGPVPVSQGGRPMPFIKRLGLSGLLSFPPDMVPFALRPLNVLVGPNGAGKSNVIDAMALLASTPVGVDRVIQAGGGADEWIWKGEWRRDAPRNAALDVETGDCLSAGRRLRYRLEFQSLFARISITEERIEEARAAPKKETPCFYYRYNQGDPLLNAVDNAKIGRRALQRIERGTILQNQSILNQLRVPQLCPELAWLGQELRKITIFREWTFGTLPPLRAPQRADDPADRLLPDARNLALILNEIFHRDDRAFRKDLQRFLPQYERVSTRIFSGTVQLFLHEHGLNTPVPSTRISDGTLRFLAILAALHTPDPPPLLCLEEPELGMHPDAVGLLAELLIEASSRMQIVVTTHSDALLSGLGDRVDSVLVCENSGRGTGVEALDPERLSSWLDEYTLGDVWRAGQLGGNP